MNREQAKTVILKVKPTYSHECSLKIVYEGYTDSCIDGMTGADEDELMLGWGTITIPKKHRKPMLKFYELEDFNSLFIDDTDWTIGQDYVDCNNSDFMIFYYHFLIHTYKSATITVKGEHIFWFIHDVFHALHDIYGTSMQCGPYEELARFKQATEVLKKRKIKMKESYLDRIVTAFNIRKWGCNFNWERTRDGISIKSFAPTSVVEHEDEYDFEF